MAIWCVTIPELGIYEQREGDTSQVQNVALLLAMQYRSVPQLDSPWVTSDPWAYERRVRLPQIAVPDRAPHGVLNAIRCHLGLRCLQCDDRMELLMIRDDDSNTVGVPVRKQGRRSLLERSKIPEWGTLRLALVYDLMLGVPPDPEAVRDWEAAGGKAPHTPAERHQASF